MATVEILLATYNSGVYLDEQLDSILHQSFTDWELLVRDGGSTDGTRQLLEEYQQSYPDRIRLLPYPEKRSGCVENFSVLLAASRAPVVMFCDHDDVWLADKVARSVAKLRDLEIHYGKDTPLLVHSDVKVVDNQLNVLAESRFAYAGLPADGYTLGLLVAESPTIGCTFAFNRALAELAGELPTDAAGHDSFLALLAVLFGQIGVIREPTMLYRQHGNNVSGANRLSVPGMIRSALDREKLNLVMEKNHYRPARLLLERYGNLMLQADAELLRDFGNFPATGFLRKKYLLAKHRIHKSHPLRNLGFQLLI